MNRRKHRQALAESSDACESAVADLIERLPLPLAMLDHSGRAVLLNAPFRQRYDVDVLTSHAVKEAVAGAGSGWKKIRIQALEGGVVERRAQALDLEGGPLLVLDEPAESETLRALDRLETQIASLRRVCSTDPLTGIWNRTHFERIITGELDRSVRHRQPVSLLLVDIDGFKAINDSFGHQAGDAVLMELVGVLQSTVRSIDMLFRWGGEEFVIVAPSTAYRGAALFEKESVARSKPTSSDLSAMPPSASGLPNMPCRRRPPCGSGAPTRRCIGQRRADGTR